jgi:hypothetical protein
VPRSGLYATTVFATFLSFSRASAGHRRERMAFCLGGQPSRNVHFTPMLMTGA